MSMYLAALIIIVLAYILGSIPTSLILGKAFKGVDVRDHGSGNAGATNTFRVLGPKIGIPVLLFDMFKGWFALYLTSYITLPDAQGEVLKILAGISVVTGHVYPVFAQFRGGKGIASLFGVFLYLLTLPVLMSLGVFLVIFLASGYVSLGSILAGLALPFFSFFATDQTSVLFSVFSCFISAFVLFTHRKNIQRLIKGTENRFRIFRK